MGVSYPPSFPPFCLIAFQAWFRTARYLSTGHRTACASADDNSICCISTGHHRASASADKRTLTLPDTM